MSEQAGRAVRRSTTLTRVEYVLPAGSDARDVGRAIEMAEREGGPSNAPNRWTIHVDGSTVVIRRELAGATTAEPLNLGAT